MNQTNTFSFIWTNIFRLFPGALQHLITTFSHTFFFLFPCNSVLALPVDLLQSLFLLLLVDFTVHGRDQLLHTAQRFTHTAVVFIRVCQRGEVTNYTYHTHRLFTVPLPVVRLLPKIMTRAFIYLSYRGDRVFVFNSQIQSFVFICLFALLTSMHCAAHTNSTLPVSVSYQKLKLYHFLTNLLS